MNNDRFGQLLWLTLNTVMANMNACYCFNFRPQPFFKKTLVPQLFDHIWKNVTPVRLGMISNVFCKLSARARHLNKLKYAAIMDWVWLH